MPIAPDLWEFCEQMTEYEKDEDVVKEYWKGYNLYSKILNKGIKHKKWLKSVLNDNNSDINPEFLWFSNQYKKLSEFIPSDKVIFDLGCGYGCQAYYFQNHKKYIAVDIHNIKEPPLENFIFYNMKISTFLNKELPKIKEKLNEEPFAICSYVPWLMDDNISLVKSSFQNCFTYYPW